MSSIAPLSAQYGMTAQGFVAKSQQVILSDLSTTLQNTYGQNLNLSAETVLGQLIGVFSEREALLWQLLEAVYASQYPGGAEGTAVDNILALNNLSRLPASPTVTDPSPSVQPGGQTLYGLVLTGTPGTVVPAGSIIRTSTIPQQSYTLDAAVTIQAAANAQQSLLLSQSPTSGAYQLSAYDTAGVAMLTPSIPYNALPTTTQISFPTTPTSGTWWLMAGAMAAGPLAYNATAAQVQAALVAATMTGITVTGSMAGGFNFAFDPNTYNRNLRTTAILITFATAPTSGTFTLAVNGVSAAALPYSATAAQVQAALVAIGYTRAQVAAVPGGYGVNFGGFTTPPTLTVAASTTSPAPVVQASNQLAPASAPNIIPSILACINGLYSATASNRPFTDVNLDGSATTINLYFGARAPQSGQPSSAAKPVSQLQVTQNSLFAGGTFVNVATAIAAIGSPAQGVGTATATQTGPNAAPAGTLTVIGSPISGWSGVNNQLDALLGRNVETDTEALVRRSTLLDAQANGPLQSIVEKVRQVSGVVAAQGFQNTNDAAVQNVTFSSTPSTGGFSLLTGAGATATLPAAPTAAQMQAALNTLPNYSAVQVTGSVAFGFAVDFAGAQGGQPQTLMQVAGNTTGTTITVGFGRSAKSFEIVVEGGSGQAVAKAIYGAQPAGIFSYGTPAAQTTGSITAGTATLVVAQSTGILPGQSVLGTGIANNTTVASISGTNVILSQPAIGTAASAAMSFGYYTQIMDAEGNPTSVGFSRPTPVLIYVALQLVTDQYRTPGVSGSGTNPLSRFSPSSIPSIQRRLADIGNALPIGATVVGQGTGGLVGAFNDVAGIAGYTLTFGTTANPVSSQNIALLPTQNPLFQVANIAVSYT